MMSSTAAGVAADQTAHVVSCGGIASSIPSRTNLLSLLVDNCSINSWDIGDAICISSSNGTTIASGCLECSVIKAMVQNQQSPNQITSSEISPRAWILLLDLSNAFLQSFKSSLRRPSTVGLLNSWVQIEGGAYFAMWGDLC